MNEKSKKELIGYCVESHSYAFRENKSVKLPWKRHSNKIYKTKQIAQEAINSYFSRERYEFRIRPTYYITSLEEIEDDIIYSEYALMWRVPGNKYNPWFVHSIYKTLRDVTDTYNLKEINNKFEWEIRKLN